MTVDCDPVPTIGEFEIDTDPCAYCGKPVRSYWHKDGRGMLSRPSITLVANWIYHTDCWNKFVEEHPP